MARKPQDEGDTPQEIARRRRAELDAIINDLPGEQTDVDYVVRSLREHYAAEFTDTDEVMVRERFKPAASPNPTATSSAAEGVIPPTPGRIVWFWKAGSNPKADKPEAALVCYVHGDSLVNLTVFEFNGVTRSETSVSLRQPRDPAWETTPFAEWMPYHKGQAAAQEKSGGKG